MTRIGVVAIGRNEGERLHRCITSVLTHTSAVVYVDSGSTDGSVPWARSRGVTTVALDLTLPFTAARARNEGFAKLLEAQPDLTFVQFVDGDCEIDPAWLDRARRELAARPDVAIVCGRRRERFPSASIYNRLCDLEWNTPVGEAQTCGGDAMVRVGSFRDVGGYRVALVAGEEPDLCVRLRGAGWKILRIDAEMTLHDAAMMHFGQWWKRNVRAGYAYAECSRLHRAGPRHTRVCRLWVRENRSNWFWGLVLPLVILALAALTDGLALLLLLAYLALGWRIYRDRRRRGTGPADARRFAFFCVLGKFAQAYGLLRYHWGRLFSRPSALIEYKGPQGRVALLDRRHSIDLTSHQLARGDRQAVPQAPRGAPVAYLINQYPHASHSFIRRELAGLEAEGLAVERFSIRRTGSELVDAADQAEQGRTTFLLDAGAGRLLSSFLTAACTRPLCWLKAARLALCLGRRSPQGLLRHVAYLAEACVLVRHLRRSGAWHLHAHFGTNSTAVALLAHALGGPPYSFTVHGPEEFDRPEGLSLRDKIERAAFVVAVCEYGRCQLFRWCDPRHWDKIHVVRCGVDGTFLQGGPQAIPQTNRLVCVGRLCEQKGQLRLLEALGCLAAAGVSFEMVLVGDGPMRPQIEAQIGRQMLGGQVRITGWVSNETVRKHILDARALVLPSFAEGLPVVIMEALALGRPVLSSYVAGIPELVENGINGWLVPAGSVEALTATLREVLEAPVARLTEMGRLGAARVALLHDARREAARLAALFRPARGPKDQR